MLHVGFFFFVEIIVIDMMISSEKVQATQSDNFSQNLGSVENQNEDEDNDDNDFDDEFELSPEYRFKESLREFSGIRDVVMKDRGHQDDDYGQLNNEKTTDSTKVTNNMVADFLNETRRVSQEETLDINELEAEFVIPYKLRPLNNLHEKSRKTVADDIMIQRISAIQAMIVRTRLRLLVNILQRANKVSAEVKYIAPERYGCSVRMYNELVFQDWPAMYPYGFLNMVRAVKETLLKSKVDNIPIAAVNEDVFKRLGFVLNHLGGRLREHGRLMYRIFEDLVINYKRLVRKFCEIPRRAEKMIVNFLDELK